MTDCYAQAEHAINAWHRVFAQIVTIFCYPPATWPAHILALPVSGTTRTRIQYFSGRKIKISNASRSSFANDNSYSARTLGTRIES